MDLYGPSLTIAVIAGVLCVAAAIISRSIAEPVLADKWGRTARLLAALALIAGAVGATTHVLYGHTPGTPQGLDPGPFLSEHPILIGVAGLAGVGIWVSR